MAPLPETTFDFKARTRHEVLAARAAKGQRERMLDDEALVQRLQEWLSNTVGDLAKPIIAAYVPAGDEPGASVSSSTGGEPGQGFVEALANAVPGARILLPVCPPGPPRSTLFPYTTLFRSTTAALGLLQRQLPQGPIWTLRTCFGGRLCWPS